jgi:DNA-binding transcriptional ArsR family regulator
MADKSNAARADRWEKPGSRKAEPAASPKRAASAGSAEISATQLDRLIHERTRLAIISALAANSSLTFSELKALLQASDGNLSVHARKLEDAGYVNCTKSFSGRTPRTEYRLTASGRRAFEKYIDQMEGLVRAAREK